MVGTKSHKTKPAADLGQLLQEARQRRRLSIQDVARALNIPSRQIEALEEGDLGVFAAEIYARGACLKYTAWLGIDMAISERAIWRALSAGRERVPLTLHTSLSWFERLLHPRLVLWLIIGCAAFGVGGYIIWQVQSFLQLPALQVEAVPAVVSAEQLALQGTADGQAQVTVNEQPVVLETGGVWHVPLTLHPGINVVRVEAKNAAGRKSVIEKHILYSHTL